MRIHPMMNVTATVVLLMAWNFACRAFLIAPYIHNRVGLTHPLSYRRTAVIGRAVSTEETSKAINAVDGTDDDSSSGEKDEKTTLTLQGTISVSSNELRKTSIEDVSEFFQNKSYRDLLVTGGGERACTDIDVTPQQLTYWRSQCVAVGACEPDENDSIVSVLTRGMEFPGLKVESSSLIGVKYVEATSDATRPKYEFVLLDTDQKVSGLPPAVWIFKKLTGAKDEEKESGENSKFKSLSTFTYEEKENGNIVFRTDASLSIGITFPKILLKILPGDKKTIEERGGTSIVKTLDKDVKQSMAAFEKAYLEKFN